MKKQKLIRIKVCLLALGVLVSTIGMTNIASAEPGKLIHNSWNPAGVMLGVTKDDISLKNEIKLCQPVPTDDTSKGVKWNWCNTDFTYSLQQLNKESVQYFPLNDLPSGGNSKRISKGEMVIVVVNILDNDPASDGYIQYSWYKKEANGDKLLTQSQKLTIPACGGYPPVMQECGIYRSVENYAYIGHFSGEIEEGGYYYVLIDTKWGQARVDFGVVPVTNGGSGDGILTVVTPAPKVTSVANIPEASVIEVTPVATPGYAYRTGSWIGAGAEKFLSGILHGFWNEIFG